MRDMSIAFIGAGQMARALAAGFVRAGLARPEKIAAADPYEASRTEFAQLVSGARVSADNAEVASSSDTVFLATKPQQVQAAVASFGRVAEGKLVVSIAAGVKLASLEAALPKSRLVRVMPNMPCLIGQSASAFAPGTRATAEDGQLVQTLLSAVGQAQKVDERLLDAVTGLSGSGPAYVFVMIEALADGGVHMGLPREVALALAAQTVRGAAQLLIESGEHPGVLKDRVASPGGTTIAGLQALEENGVRAALMAAVEAATLRSIELGNL